MTTDAYYRRRLKRELERMDKLDTKIATESERSFHEWLAGKMAAPAMMRRRRDAIGWLWRTLTGRAT